MTPKTPKTEQKPRKPRSVPDKRQELGHSKEAKQARIDAFVEAYLSNGNNKRQAALSAGASSRSCDNFAQRMMKNAQVLSRIEQRQCELREKFELTTEGVLKNLAQAVYFDPRKLYNEDGTLKAIHELDDDTAMALAGFEAVESVIGTGEDALPIVTKKYKWLDKNSARDQANKILGHYEKDNKQGGEAVAAAVTTGIDALRAQFAKVLAK